MEYATREQAQQAVAQLSNQNLMGRLVYVREVGGAEFRSEGCAAKVKLRIVRQNLDLSGPRAVTVVDMPAVPAAATAAPAAPAALLVSTPDTAALLVAAVDKFTSPTYVYFPLTILFPSCFALGARN